MAVVRLIAAGSKTDGHYRAAIAITMKTGSHTYWKQPGDAGVPPVFAFNGSTNISAADVLFPVPARIEEEGLDAFGYTDAVAFPVDVTPTDPTKPSALHVEIAYAVCNRICIPASAKADLALPAPRTAEDDSRVALAFSAVPLPLPVARQGDLAVERVAGAAKPTWILSWRGTMPLTDIFAAAPEGFAFDTRRAAEPGRWTLVAAQVVTAPGQTSVPVALTLAAAAQGFLTTRTLDLPSSAAK